MSGVSQNYIYFFWLAKHIFFVVPQNFSDQFMCAMRRKTLRITAVECLYCLPHGHGYKGLDQLHMGRIPKDSHSSRLKVWVA